MEELNMISDITGFYFPLIFVRGTAGDTYKFGQGDETRQVSIADFYISKFPVTQKLWKLVTGNNPAIHNGDEYPVENVSHVDISAADGFLHLLGKKLQQPFRLPAETEWEYASRGGIHWKDNLIFSGSNNADEVAWYKSNSNDQTKKVGLKKPNQLGISDMCGNVWEWCEDYYHADISTIPDDGTACRLNSNERVLRGGCFHNWAIHCISAKRYEIGEVFKDGCIGFRIALSHP